MELFMEQPGMQRSALQALARLVDEHPRVREVLLHVMNTAEQAEIRRLAADSLGARPSGRTAPVAAPETEKKTGR
jgi:hypothetical protein